MTFKINNSDVIDNFLTQITDKMPSIIKKTLNDYADFLIDEIQKTAPLDTADYANSWKKGTISGNSISVLTDQGLLYIILEFTGRAPGKIFGNPILHFVIDGKDIFAKSIDHPGFPPMPHVRPALKKLKSQQQQIFYNNLKKEINSFK